MMQKDIKDVQDGRLSLHDFCDKHPALNVLKKFTLRGALYHMTLLTTRLRDGTSVALAVQEFVSPAAAFMRGDRPFDNMNWEGLVGLDLESHGSEMVSTILKRIQKRLGPNEMLMDEDAFNNVLCTLCTDELERLERHAADASMPAHDALSAEDRRKRISDYDHMDFCDDFKSFCEYYKLPFADFGWEHGACMLGKYIDALKKVD